MVLKRLMHTSAAIAAVFVALWHGACETEWVLHDGKIGVEWMLAPAGGRLGGRPAVKQR